MQQRRAGRFVGPVLAGLIGVVAVAAYAVLSGSPRPEFPASPPPEPVPWTRLEVGPAHPWAGPPFTAGTAYGDGLVLVGRRQIFVVEPDSSWPEVAAAAVELDAVFLADVATDGALLVAIGDHAGANASWTSRDGRRWDFQGDIPELAGRNFFGIAGSSAGFLARAGTPTGTVELYLSVDGVDWRLVDPAQFGDGTVSDVGGYRGGWIATGAGPDLTNGRSFPPDTRARAWWSVDGTTWHRASISDAHPAVGSVLPASAGVLALGGPDCGRCVGPGNVFRSTDGATWDAPHPDPIRHGGLYVSDGARLVRWASQDDGAIAWSSDGVAWHDLGEPVYHGASGALYLGSEVMVVTFEVVEDEEQPSESFVQLLRPR